MQFHEILGHRLAYIPHNEDAPGIPLIFIHGATASVRFWEAAMFDEIRARHPWYAVSLPCHAPSECLRPLRERDLTEELFFQLLDEQIRRLVGERPVLLVGYSVGGFSAYNFAAKCPERTLGVVSVGGFGRGRAKGLERVLEFLANGGWVGKSLFHLSWWTMQQSYFFLKQAVKGYACDVPALLDYPQLEATLRNIFPDVRRHNRTHMRYLFRWLLHLDVTDEIQHITCPVLHFAGECDPVIPYEHQRRFAGRLPDCRFVSLPGAGHVVFAERAERFEAEFLRFVREVNGRTV